MTPEQVIRESFSRPPSELRQTADELWSPDIVYREDARWPDAGAYRGREAVVARFEDYQQALNVAEMEIGEVVVSGERIFWTVRVRAAGAGSGAPTDHWWGYVGEVRDGVIVEFRAYFDHTEARAALEER